jgi:hypothetical protein
MILIFRQLSIFCTIAISFLTFSCGDGGSPFATKNGTYTCNTDDSEVTINIIGDSWTAEVTRTFPWGDTRTEYLTGEVRDGELYVEDSFLSSLANFSENNLYLKKDDIKCIKN